MGSTKRSFIYIFKFQWASKVSVLEYYNVPKLPRFFENKRLTLFVIKLFKN